MSDQNRTEELPQVALFWDNYHRIHRETEGEPLNHSVNPDYIALDLNRYVEECHKLALDPGNIRGLKIWLQTSKRHPYVGNKSVRSQHNKNKTKRCMVFERFPEGADLRPRVRRFTTDLSGFASEALADELYRLAFSIEEVLLLMGAEPGQDYTAIELVQEAGRYLRKENWQEMDRPIPVEPRGQIL